MNKRQNKLLFHPWRVFTYLSILGISSAFLTILGCLVFTLLEHPIPTFRLPSIFHANTVLILFSSYSIWQVKTALVHDDHRQIRLHLLITACAGVLFTALQIVGWKELKMQGVLFTNNITGTYIYVLSGLHILHLLVGVGWLIYLAYQSYVIRLDAYAILLFDTNPNEKLKIELAATYWHYVDGLWVVLYLCLLMVLGL